jgi:hypothetical protein
LHNGFTTVVAAKARGTTNSAQVATDASNAALYMFPPLYILFFTVTITSQELQAVFGGIDTGGHRTEVASDWVPAVSNKSSGASWTRCA